MLTRLSGSLVEPSITNWKLTSVEVRSQCLENIFEVKKNLLWNNNKRYLFLRTTFNECHELTTANIYLKKNNLF
jgi:hypothetical protein